MSLKIPVGPQDHVQGDPSAKCTLVEYGDYECPALRAGVSHRKTDTKTFWQADEICFPELSLERNASTCGVCRGNRGVRGYA